jgi:hypothetical protein
MFKPKVIRTILIVIGAGLLVSLSFFSFRQPAPTDASLVTLVPRATITSGPLDGEPGTGYGGGSESDNDKSDKIKAAIYGQVIDLSTGRPGQALEIEINGSIVRTDTDGRYSLTGLNAGAYQVALLLPGQAAAAQSVQTVHLAEEETVTVDLTYYSQSPPTPTPTEPPPPTPTPLPLEPEASVANNNIVPEAQERRTTFSPLTPVTGGDPTVWINPGYINNEEGVSGQIAVDVANVNDLGAFQAVLYFDPKIIEIEDVVLGNFLDSTGRQTNPLVTEIDDTSGEISFVAFTSGDTAGPDGGGTLAVINFTSKQPGLTDLELNDVRLVARLGKIIDAHVGHGQINVISCFGDLNEDDVIDVGDVQAVAGRVGQTLDDPNYVLEFDLNNDTLIDEALVTDRLYEACP